MKQKQDLLSEALDKFYKLAQAKRSLEEYFEEVRFIQKHVPRELHSQLAEKTIQGLDDEIVRRVTGGILRGKQKSMDEVLEVIQSATGSTQAEKEPIKSGKEVSNKYSGWKPKDKLFA